MVSKLVWLFLGVFALVVNGQNYADSLKRGEQYLQKEDYLSAFSYFLKLTSKLEDEKLKNKELAYSYMYLGNCYEYFEYGDRSQANLRKAIDLFGQLKDQEGLAYAHTYMGDIIEDEGKVEEAMVGYKLALQHFTEGKNEKGKALVYDNIASTYENMAKYDSALYFLEKAYKIYVEQNNALGMAQVLNDCGDVYRKWKKAKESLGYYQKAYKVSKDIKSEEEQRSNLRDIAKTYALMGNYKDAYFSFEQFYEANWKLKFDKKIDEITQIHVSQMQLHKNHEIELLREKQRVEHIKYLAMIAAAVLFVVAGGIVFLFWQIKRKKEVELEAAQKNLLLSELKSSELVRKSLEKELFEKKQGLNDYTKLLIERNELVEQLKKRLSETIEKQEVQKSIRNKMLDELIETTILTDDDWKVFKKKFDDVHPDFFNNIKSRFPELSTGDQRLIAVMRLNLSQKEMASMLGVSEDSVKKAKQRLRAKVSNEADFKLKDWVDTL
jgi:tetratricopeptide (TPR) repeat protein